MKTSISDKHDKVQRLYRQLNVVRNSALKNMQAVGQVEFNAAYSKLSNDVGILKTLVNQFGGNK